MEGLAGCRVALREARCPADPDGVLLCSPPHSPSHRQAYYFSNPKSECFLRVLKATFPYVICIICINMRECQSFLRPSHSTSNH